ncbi:MAG: hypothetical protein ACT4P2_03705 [Pseudomonadota bacterium]
MLTSDPLPPDHRRLANWPDLFVVDVGDFEIVYMFDEGEILVPYIQQHKVPIVS